MRANASCALCEAKLVAVAKNYVRTQTSACCLFLSGIPVSLKNSVTVGVDPLPIIEYLVLERIRGEAVGDFKC